MQVERRSVLFDLVSAVLALFGVPPAKAARSTEWGDSDSDGYRQYSGPEACEWAGQTGQAGRIEPGRYARLNRYATEQHSWENADISPRDVMKVISHPSMIFGDNRYDDQTTVRCESVDTKTNTTRQHYLRTWHLKLVLDRKEILAYELRRKAAIW